MNFKILDLSKGLFESKYGKIILIIIALACVLVLFWPSKSQGSKEDKNTKETTTQQYITDTEDKIGKMISGIEGAGRCRVVLSCKSGEETVFARENNESYYNSMTTTENSGTKILIIKEKGGGESPVITKTLMPEFKGAVVICDGAENTKTKRLIIEAVSIALNIKTNNISVIKSNN